MTLKILSYNIRRGGVGREPHLAAVINQLAPHIVVLQEAIRPDVVRRLADATDMGHMAASHGRSLAFISRVPIAEHHWVRPLWSKRAFLEIVPDGMDVRIIGVHLSAVHAAWTERRRVHELRSLLAATERYGDTFHLVVGDFNTIAPDEQLNAHRLPYRLRLLVWLSGGRIRWQTIAIMLGADYVDGYRIHNASDTGYTFPTWDPHVRLDYAFVPKPFADRLTHCEVVRENPSIALASDHFPLRADVRCDRPPSVNHPSRE